MQIKILAAADMHLGMKFSGYPEVQSELCEARFDTLKSLVEEANSEQCGLFIIAGDLFDRVIVSKKDIMRTTALLNEFQGDALAVLPGNHDFYAGSATTLWKTFREGAGDRIIVLDNRKVYDLNHYGLNVKLYAGPCDSKHSNENAVSGFSPVEEAMPDTLLLGVAHGSMEGISLDSEGNYFPMKKAELDRLKLDFWIVGHTHNQHPSPESLDNSLFIPGTPEPDGIDCRHGGKAWIIEVHDNKKIIKKSINTGKYRFFFEEIELDKNQDFEKLFAKYKASDFENTLVMITLKGRLSRDNVAVLRKKIDDLEGSLFRARIDDSLVAEEITPGLIEDEFTEGSFPYLLLKKLIEEQDSEALQTAYAMILDAKS